MSTIRIGISGFRYAHWRGAFYPNGLPQRQELAYAASRVGSIEINGSFYSLQRRAFIGSGVRQCQLAMCSRSRAGASSRT